MEAEPLTAGGFLVEETEGDGTVEFFGRKFRVLLVPGHCPGSLCFLDVAKGQLYGGDVLFAGAVGRWDLPAGDRDLLLRGIRQKILPLGDAIEILPGHGPATTVGQERLTNPYLR